MKAIRLLALFLCALAFAGVQDQTYDLVWKPKEGQAFTYALSFTTKAEEVEVAFGADLAITVKTVEKNGDYTLETRFQHPTVTIDGEKQDLGDDGKDEDPTIEKYNAKGERIDGDKGDKDEEEGDDPLGLAMTRIVDFNAPDKPIKAGDKWTKELADDEKTKSRPAKVEYTAVGIEKIGDAEVMKVTFTFAETEGDKPVKADGEFYIQISDGLLVKSQSTIENVPLGDAEGVRGTAKVKVERKSS